MTVDKDVADAIANLAADLAEMKKAREIADQRLVKAFALLDEQHSKITAFISWTDQAPRASVEGTKND